MQILYFYIAEHALLKNQNINLGGKYRFHYNPEESQFIVSLNPYYLEGFFDLNQGNQKLAKINNLTAVVGQNGTGKTSLLEFIKEHLIADVDGPRVPIILAVQEQSEIKVYHFKDIRIRSSNASEFGIQLEVLKPGVDFYSAEEIRFRPPVRIDDFQSTTFVHFSNVFDGKREYASSGLKDISTNHLVTEDHRQESDKKHIDYYTNQIESFLGREIERQIDFINDFRNDKVIEFKLPDYLEVSAKLKTNLKNRQFTRKETNKINESFLAPLLGKLDEKDIYVHPENGNFDTRQTTINYFTYIALYNIIYDLILHSGFGRKYTHSKPAKLPDGPMSNEDIIKALFEIFNEVAKIDDQSTLGSFGHALDYISSYINLLPDYIKDDTTIFVSEGSRFNLSLNKDSFAKFYDIYKRSFVHTPYLSFSWSGISSGEKAYLNILSRFYSLSDSLVKDADERLRNNVIILIDEGDVYLHPEWQRQFSSLLLKYLPVLLKGDQQYIQRELQIIYTTNSPIPISDLPNTNVVFLKRSDGQTIVQDSLEDKKLTFGANIHTLLADSFFLTNGLMGEFAKAKINQVIEILQGSKEEIFRQRTELEILISQIGEPLIRTKLSQLMTERLQLNMMNVDERISALEREIAVLRSQNRGE